MKVLTSVSCLRQVVCALKKSNLKWALLNLITFQIIVILVSSWGSHKNVTIGLITGFSKSHKTTQHDIVWAPVVVVMGHWLFSGRLNSTGNLDSGQKSFWLMFLGLLTLCEKISYMYSYLFAQKLRERDIERVMPFLVLLFLFRNKLIVIRLSAKKAYRWVSI